MKIFNIFIIVLIGILVKCDAAGEVRDMDANAEELKPVLQFAEQMLDKAVNSLYIHKVGTVLKAQKQIVAGDKYYLTFEFKETTCLKNKPIDEQCSSVSTRTEICSVQVWSRPWLTDSKMLLTSFNCNAQ